LSLAEAITFFLGAAPRIAALADLRQQWAQWYAYRAARGLPNTARALGSQARDLEAMGSTEAWHAMTWTMDNCWQTIYPKPKSLPRPPLPSVTKAVGAATAGYMARLHPTDQRVFTDYQDEARRLPNWPKTSGRDGLSALLDKVDNNLDRTGATLFRRWVDDEFARPAPLS